MTKVVQNILVASADVQLFKNLNSGLTDSGYKVVSAADGIEALYVAERSNASVVVLDSEISKIPAADVVRMIKKCVDEWTAKASFVCTTCTIIIISCNLLE